MRPLKPHIDMHISRLAALTTGALLLGSSAAEASTSISELIDQIIESNKDLKAQRMGIKAQRLADADANALADPEVSVGRVWGRHGIGNKLQLDVSQEIEWPALYSQRSKAADMAQNTASLQYDAAEVELRSQLTALLYELVYVRRQWAEKESVLSNYDKTINHIKENGKDSDLTKIDLMKLDYESYKMKSDLAALKAREVQICGSVQAYTRIQLDLDDINEYPLQPLLSAEEYMRQAASSPMFEALKATAEHEDQNARVAYMSRFPTLSLGYQHQAELGDRFNGFTVGMNLPVFQGRHAKKAAMERKDAAELQLQNLTEKTGAELVALYQQAKMLQERMEAYRNVFSGTEYLDLVMEAYKGGEINVLDYVAETQYFSDTVLMYMEMEYNYNATLSALNKYAK